ncbi:MAG: hypothetical protein GX813_02385 [Erysipelotrichia bacterium]|nr:hypothetical protein [Erysipelotrichia bacterium]
MENKFVNLITSRVSCRAYLSKRVPLKKVQAVAEAGKYAPSARNRQIINIYVVKSENKVEELRNLSLEILERDCMHGVKTIILVAGPRGDDYTDIDGSCSLENMFLAAHALGLGSCWINQFDRLLQSDKGSKIKKSFGIPENFKIVGACALGYIKEGISLEIKERKADFINFI